MLHAALAVAAALVALAFALATFERWYLRRKPHELAWSVALVQFSLAAAALAAGEGVGWDAPTFRLFYLAGAITNVPWLALGTVYLLGGRRRGDRWLAVVALFTAFAAGVLLVAPLTAPVPADRLPQGSDVFGALPRVLAAVGSGAGALVVFAGAAWSAWRIRRGPALVANLLIALGTLILANSGLLNSVLDEITGFVVTLLLGITVLFAGFLVATGATRGAAPGAAASPPARTGAKPRS